MKAIRRVIGAVCVCETGRMMARNAVGVEYESRGGCGGMRSKT
jgi:hypothetical protein